MISSFECLLLHLWACLNFFKAIKKGAESVLGDAKQHVYKLYTFV